MESAIKTIAIYPDRIRLLDQRKLPLMEEYVDCRTYQEVAEAIRTMVVRGAPAIGVAAAGGIAVGGSAGVDDVGGRDGCLTVHG